MVWQGIRGHDRVVNQFRRSLERGRLANTLLFLGPPGVGKKAVALKLAQALLCCESPPGDLSPCGACESCIQALAGTHPDLEVISKPPEKSFIPLAALIGGEGQRMHEGLCHWIGLKPFMGGRKIAIIDDADQLNDEGANCLLKTLEEPPPRSLLILISTSLERLLPTIRSRSQVIRFEPLSAADIAEILLADESVSNPDEARRIANFSEGSLAHARRLLDEEVWNFRNLLLSQLARLPRDSVRLAHQLSDFVDGAGKEASERRERSRLIIRFATGFFRQLLHRSMGMPAEGDEQFDAAVSANEKLLAQPAEHWVESIDRSVDALSQIDRNVNQAILIEAWIDDLSGLASASFV